MTWPAQLNHQETTMKITVIKKAVVNAKPNGWCATFVDEGLLNKR